MPTATAILIEANRARAAEAECLGDEIAELSAHIEAATARLLELIREFDARQGWAGFRDCAAWLGWRVGLGAGAARERVRVARALGDLPILADALARGELSYAKVRALTRIATPETQERLLAVGRGGTAAQVERIVRAWRWVDRKAEARESARRHLERALHVFTDDDGTVVLRGRLEPEVGALLVRALEAARESLLGDGALQFRRPDGRILPDVPPPASVCADPVQTLRSRHDARGLSLHSRTLCPHWLGQPFDLGYAIDVLHPLAQGRFGCSS